MKYNYRVYTENSAIRPCKVISTIMERDNVHFCLITYVRFNHRLDLIRNFPEAFTVFCLTRKRRGSKSAKNSNS